MTTHTSLPPKVNGHLSQVRASDGSIVERPQAAHRQEPVDTIHCKESLATIPPVKTLSDPQEVELKFQLQPGSRAILEAKAIFAGAPTVQRQQVTTYFDTPDNVLNRAGLILRVRQSDGSYMQTVKSCTNRLGVASSRREWEWPTGGPCPDLTHLSETKDLARFSQVLAGRLVPVFLTDVNRTTYLLHLQAGTIVEAAFDEGKIVAGGASEAVSELELELKGGRLGPMYRLAVDAQRLAPMRISTESKSARGWHLRTGQTEGARKAKIPKLKRRVRVAHGCSEIISETLGHLTSNIAPTLRGDPEGIHQMRTALRASRAALELFEPLLDTMVAERFDAELQGVGRLFGIARDWDVFCLQTLSTATEDMPAERFWDLKQVAESERELANAAVVDAIRGQSFTALVLGLAAWTAEISAQSCNLGDDRMGKHLVTLAPSLLDRVAAKVAKRQHHKGKLSAEGRHNLRKALDKLCDDVKFLARIFPRRKLDRYRDRCEDVQAILGMANDAEVAQRLVSTLVTYRRADLAKPAETLARWSHQRGRKALQGLACAIDDLRAVPAFWR